MRNHVYLFAAAIFAATSAPALSSELIIGDTTMIVYEDNYASTAPDGSYGETYLSGEEIVYVDEGTMIEADYVATDDDQFIYSSESIEQIYSIDGVETVQDVMPMTETLDGIVYETVTVPQTY